MKKNNRGFTLAELLIVVAIIAVLVAIAIPVFTTQLEKSREATDVANVRSAYAGVVTEYLTNAKATQATVEVQQRVSDWQTSPQPYLEVMDGAKTGSLSWDAKTTGNYTVSIDLNGSVTVDGAEPTWAGTTGGTPGTGG